MTLPPDWANRATRALEEALPGVTVLRSEDPVPPADPTPAPSCTRRCLPEGGLMRFRRLVQWLKQEGVDPTRAAEVARDMVLAGEA